MTINELIARLEDIREELGGEDVGGEVEVRLMTQENWPFENGITGLALSRDIKAADDEDDEDEDDEPRGEKDEDDMILYIVEGSQICYGSKLAWQVAS